MPNNIDDQKTQTSHKDPSKGNIANSIMAAAEKDIRAKPWQPANHSEKVMIEGHSSGVKPKDDYWMAEGSVNASS